MKDTHATLNNMCVLHNKALFREFYRRFVVFVFLVPSLFPVSLFETVVSFLCFSSFITFFLYYYFFVSNNSDSVMML